MKVPTVFRLILTLSVMVGAAACSSGSPLESTPTPVVLLTADQNPTPAPTAAPEPTPTPYVINAKIPTGHYGKAVASVEERVFLSDAVVKARFVSAGSDLLRFHAVEYLKGTGPTKFSVKAETAGRATQWDRQEAILFLTRRAATDADYDFTDTTAWNYMVGTDVESELATTSTEYTGVLPEGYTVKSRNPVWLPVETSAMGNARSISESGAGIVTEYAADGTPRTTSEQAIRRTVDWLATPRSGGGASLPRNIGYRNAPLTVGTRERDLCIRSSLYVIRDGRDYEAHHGKPRPRGAKTYDVGPSTNWGGYHLSNTFTRSNYGPFRLGTETYDRRALTGGNAHLFRLVTTDDDRNAANGYTVEFTLRRPLPAGTYRLEYDSVFYLWSLCDFDPTLLNADITVRVTAPPGTLHEAFFDPATTTAGVGYLATTSTTTGVLEPAGLSVRGRAITITGLTWQNGRVVLTLDRFGSWLDGFSFIEPDGTVGLRLAEVDATKDWTARTLTWEVSEQPWEPGDELMLRMGPIPLPAVRNLTAEANSAGEVVLRWEVAYRAGVSGYRIWRHRPGRDEGPRIYVSDTLSTDTTYTDANSPVPNLTEYRVQAIDRVYNAGESSESVRVGSQ